MLKKLAKIALAAVLILAGAMLTLASPSHAYSTTEEANFTYFPTEIAKIGVNSDGTAYAVTGLMSISAEVEVDISFHPGEFAHVKKWKTWLRVRTETGSWDEFKDDGVSFTYPLLHRPTKVDELVQVGVPHLSLMPVAVGYCNAMADSLRAQGKSNEEIFSQDHTIPILIRALMSYEATGINFVPNPGSQAGENDFSNFSSKINLVCKGREEGKPLDTPTGDVAFDHGEMKFKEIKLSASTFSNAFTKPNATTTCKKGRLKVILKVSKAGHVQFKLWKQVGGDAMTSEVIDAWASFDGNSGYEAEYVEWVPVSAPTLLKAKAEEMVSNFGTSTPWKEIMLQCQSGGGGLATDTSDRVVTGSLAIGDTGGNKCPRTGQLGITLNSNYSMPIPYRVTCNNGIDQNGSLQPVKDGEAWKATHQVLFQNQKTQLLGCALWHKPIGLPKILDIENQQFTCRTPGVQTGGGGGLAPDSGRPDDLPPQATYEGALAVNTVPLGPPNAPIPDPSNQCPRKAQLTFQIKSSVSTDIDYKVDCTGDRSWQGTVEMFSVPGEPAKTKYWGAGKEYFDITKTEKISCALKRAKGDMEYFLGFDTEQFTCRTPGVQTGSKDIAPDSGRPDDPPPQAKTLTGDFSFAADPGSPKCPRQVNALLSFKSPKSDNIHYSLDCKTESSSGVVPTVPNPAGGFLSAAVVSLDVEKTVDQSCTLKTVAPYGNKTHTTKTRIFQCVTPAVEPGSDDIARDTGRPEDPPPTAKYDGELTVADSALVPANQCPREGQAVAKINSNKSSAVDYTMACTGGHSWQGTVQMFANGPGKYQGVVAKTFPVTQTEQVSCALKRVKNGQPHFLAIGARQFTCIKRNVEPGGANVLLPDTRPEPSAQIACLNGRAIGDMCLCERGHRLVKTGDRNYRCDKRTPAAVVVTPQNVPGVSILCRPGYKLVGKNCVKKPVIVVRCKSNERLVRGSCLCKPGYQRIRQSCVKPPPVIVVRCKSNERLVRGSCLCKPGYQRIGPSCVRPPVIAVRCKSNELLFRGRCIKKPNVPAVTGVAPTPSPPASAVIIRRR